MSDSLQPHGLQASLSFIPWNLLRFMSIELVSMCITMWRALNGRSVHEVWEVWSQNGYTFALLGCGEGPPWPAEVSNLVSHAHICP